MTQDLLSATGQFETKQASKYLQQLCKHFAHKVEVSYDASAGRVAFPMGPATMTATEDVLSVSVSGRTKDEVTRAKGIIDSHLARFAFRENFEKMDWR